MGQKQKKHAVKRLTAGVLALMMMVALTGQYTVSAQGQQKQNGSETQEASPPEAQGQQVPEQQAVSAPEAQISFRAVQAELEDVNVTLEINGEAMQITYPAGLITEHLDSLDQYLTGNEEFYRAVLRKTELDGSITEKEIFRIGTYGDQVYYSLSEQQDTGILLAEGEKLVLICADQYQISYNCGEFGRIEGPDTIWKGEGLEAAVTAEKYYHISSVSWSDANGSHSLEITDEDNMQVSVPAEQISGDITVTAAFEKDDPYTITAGQIQQGGICLNQGQESDEYYPDGVDQPIPPVEPGSTQTFMVFSQSWTGGEEWYLNMMRINGENIKVPLNYEVGTTSEPTTLSNGSVVTIKLVNKDVGLYWKDGDPWYGSLGAFWGWHKERCLYEVTVTDVQENLVIDLNFKVDSSREMIMTGLEGIASCGAASESYDWETHLDPDLTGYHYYYDVQENDGDTVYQAYWNNTSGALAQAYNIYLYTVKPGYNPNTVSLEVFYDGVQMDSKDAIMTLRDGSGNPAWMLTISEMVAGQTTNFRHFDNFVADANAAGYTHCFALNQNDKYNQLLRLTANPYEYHLVFDLAQGAYDKNDFDYEKYAYDEEAGIVTERGTSEEDTSEEGWKIYTLADGNVSVNMPMDEPEKEGCIFKGWQLYKDGAPVDETLYSANQQFIIDENTIQYAGGDEKLDENHAFTFVAQWENVADSTETAAYTIEYYKEDPDNGTVEFNGKKYSLYYSASDYGTVGSTIVALNDRHPGQGYRLNEHSKIQIDSLPDETDMENYPDNHTLTFYYDLNTYSLTIVKDVKEDGDLTRAYDIEITLWDEENRLVNGTYGNVTFTDGKTTVSLKDNEQAVLTDIPTGYKYSVEETESLPNGYKVTYKTGDGQPSDTSPQNVELASDTTVTVINTRTVTPDTGLLTGSSAAGTGAGIAAAGCVAVLLLNRRKKHV